VTAGVPVTVTAAAGAAAQTAHASAVSGNTTKETASPVVTTQAMQSSIGTTDDGSFGDDDVTQLALTMIGTRRRHAAAR
jgi:hypothetical protein